jgi:methanogenic corrinoid protein MtbC1
MSNPTNATQTDTNPTNAIQTDINTLNAISENLQKAYAYIAQHHKDGLDLLENLQSAKSNLDQAVVILKNYSEEIADLYKAPSPHPETF